MRKQLFNDDWLFKDGGTSSTESLMGGPAEPVPVTLPHDASIGLPRNPAEPDGGGNGFFQEHDYIYTKRFTLDPADEGKSVWIEFEGVYQNAFVYVNSSYAGQNPYGYGSFYLDITHLVHTGAENEIKVQVNNGVPSGRWYTGGGIYRDVHLMVADRTHIVPDGVQLAALDVDEGLATVRVRTTLEHKGLGTRKVRLVTELIDAEGDVAAKDQIPATILEGSTNTYQQRLYVRNPHLWDEDSPYLYTYRTYILDGDQVVDEETGTYGIRKLQLDHDHGLRVNGKEVLLRGGCVHHDYGITGTADFEHAAEHRIKELKAAGYNAVRTAHDPASRKLLEACDKYGMYVMEEYTDVWTTTKVEYDYGMHMPTWWEHDVGNLVRKDYNHPSVVLYSIGNEIPETGDRFDVLWGKKLADRFRELDDSRFVMNCLNLMLSSQPRLPEILAEIGAEKTAEGKDADLVNQEINSLMNDFGAMMGVVIGSNIAGDVIEEASSQVDLIGYNYAPSRYERDGEAYPNRIICGSEEYPQNLDENWALVEKLPYVIGDFDWTAWDYLGECGVGRITYDNPPTGFYADYPYRSAYVGDINLTGDRRPISYWREIIWGRRSAPYIAVQPPEHHGHLKIMSAWGMSDAVRSWTWKGYEGKPVTVEVYADADEAELLVNGASQGKASMSEEKRDIFMFETVYEPGTIEVVAYKDGEEVGRDSIKTAGDEVVISAALDVDAIPADGSDIGYIKAAIVDAEGNLNMDAAKSISIAVEGPAKIEGFGSASPVTEENFFDTCVKTFEGRVMAAVRGTGEAGTAKVTLSAEGCPNAVVEVPVR